MRTGVATTRWRHLPLVLTIALIVGWFLLLAPTWIGGPATYVWVSGDSMEPTLRSGDFVILRRADAYASGDVVVYRVPQGEPGAGTLVIHRIVGGSAEAGFVTQGDNKQHPDRWRPTSRDVLGSRWLVVPEAGRLIGWLRDPAIFASLAAGITVFAVMLIDWGPGPRRPGRASLLRWPARRPADGED
jgi:signal peptidase